VVPADERVVSFDFGVVWDPNGALPVLVHYGNRAIFAIEPHPAADTDPRLVLFEWIDCRAAVLCGPNYEAIAGHRLFDKGLRDCEWSGEVLDSRWIAGMEQANSVHARHDPARFAGLHHWILLHKEGVHEVVASEVQFHRLPGPHLAAAREVLRV
jgi:hypothetical protein